MKNILKYKRTCIPIRPYVTHMMYSIAFHVIMCYFPEVECPVDITVAHGNTVIDSHTLGELALLTCDEGHYLSVNTSLFDRTTLVCAPSGEWDVADVESGGREELTMDVVHLGCEGVYRRNLTI